MLERAATLYVSASEFKRALPLMEQLLEMRERNPRQYLGLTEALMGLAMVRSALDDHTNALPLAQRALAINEKARGGAGYYTAQSLLVLGRVLANMGDYPGALARVERCVELVQRDSRWGASDGNSSAATGATTANRALNVTLPHEQPGAMRRLESYCLQALALVSWNMGDYPAVQALVSQGVAIETELGGTDGAGVLNARGTLALLHSSLGDYAKAAAIHEAALAHWEKVPDDAQVARVLHNLAWVLRERGDPAAALPLAQRAVDIEEKRSPVLASSLATYAVGLALVQDALGRNDAALVSYRRSLELRERVLGPHHPLVAQALVALAQFYTRQGQSSLALPMLDRALYIAYEARAAPVLWAAQDALRTALERSGHRALAIFYGKQAVNTLQTVLVRIRSLGPEMQRSFLRKNSAPYRAFAELLDQEGRKVEAQQVVAMLNDDQFTNPVGGRGRMSYEGSQLRYTDVEVPWRQRILEVTLHLRTTTQYLAELEQLAREGLSDEERLRREQHLADRKAAEQSFAALLGELIQEAGAAGARAVRP